MRHLLRIFIIVAAALTVAAANAQTRDIVGRVTDRAGEPIAGASLRVYASKKTVAHGVTDAEGKFSLHLPGDTPDTLRLVTNCLDFEKYETTITKETKDLKIVLSNSTTQLKEVVVKAPDARQRGDTTSFRLHAFASKRDVTLEEGLKKLPGIEVSGNGTISYLGRNISNFYVEGLQLAGSQYNRVTRNLPSEYVTNVELIENFNEAKIDSGRQSDDVAMNVRLSGKVRFRPVGTAEAGAGVRSDDLLYSLGATGMLFAPSFQTMVNLKGGNLKEFSLDQSNGTLASGARSAVGSLSGDTPPLPSQQYKAFDDHIISVNAVKSLSGDRTMNANAFYAYSHNAYSYDSRVAYFTGDDKTPVVFAEKYSPMSSVYRGGVKIDYSSNKRQSWISNRLSADYEFQHGSLDAMLADNASVLQSMLNRTLRISDDIRLSFRRGEKRYSVSAGLGYYLTPTATVKVSDTPSGTLSGLQSADSHTLTASLATSFDWLLTKASSLNFPVDADMRVEAIKTRWNPYGYANDGYGQRGSVRIRPTYELVTDNRKLELNIGVGGRMMFMTAGNHATSDRQRLNRLFLSPVLRLSYNPTSRIAIKLIGSYDEDAGDISELLTEKIMKSFRVETVRSGVIARSSTLLGSLDARYSNLLSLWFADMRITASRLNLNTIGTTDVSSGQISSGYLQSDNHVDALTGSAGLSKHVRSIGLRMGVRGVLGVNKSQTIQQGERVSVDNTSVSIRPTVTFAPVKWIEMQIDASWSQTLSKYLQTERKTSGWNNRGRLSLFPIETFEIFGQIDCISKHDVGVSYPTVCILDAGINWKVGKTRLSLNAVNLLNKKRYYYTSFNELNTFSYDFALQPRSFSLSALFVF